MYLSFFHLQKFPHYLSILHQKRSSAFFHPQKEQMTGEFGYSYNFLSDNSKTVLFYIGGTALAGYESVNWGKRTMSDGATLQNKGAFIYGGAVALETEIYLSDAIALTASVKERLVWGNSTGHFHTQFGIGMKFIIN